MKPRKKRSRTKCANCKKGIPRSEPNLVLENLITGGQRFYHERCSQGAMALVMDKPAAWILTHRFVDAGAN